MATPFARYQSERDHLAGWKEIAAYLGKSVRTVQRWERDYGLPVHRVAGATDIIFSSRFEIERWKRLPAVRSAASANQDGALPTVEVASVPPDGRPVTVPQSHGAAVSHDAAALARRGVVPNALSPAVGRPANGSASLSTGVAAPAASRGAVSIISARRRSSRRKALRDALRRVVRWMRLSARP
jgi:hypothetical protein